ncbi:MAG: hypothetical protein ACYCT9_13370 [Leptospirillum sp.]
MDGDFLFRTTKVERSVGEEPEGRAEKTALEGQEREPLMGNSEPADDDRNIRIAWWAFSLRVMRSMARFRREAMFWGAKRVRTIERSSLKVMSQTQWRDSSPE